jgi:hypothetical protein
MEKKGTYDVSPALPEGMELDPATGVISGTPKAVTPDTKYTVSFTTELGSAVGELIFKVVEEVRADDVVNSISKAYAERIEAVIDINELFEEPSKTLAIGDWMTWMVARAALNDPTLTEFNFNNIHMPKPHEAEMIAPKLMKAMATNTHIKVLSLTNSMLQKNSGCELAESLKLNTTLKILNLEANELDSNAVKEIALGISENDECAIEEVRLSPQKGVGAFFGRPVEEAMGLMMERKDRILKLGFECDDAHWRNTITRTLLRHNDFARRRRRRSTADEAEEVQAEDRTLGSIMLKVPPEMTAAEVFAGAAAENEVMVIRHFLEKEKRLPTTAQLQAFGSSNKTPLKYSTVAPLIKECRGRMLDAAKTKEIEVTDTWQVDSVGTLRTWEVHNTNWNLDVRSEGHRYAYKSDKDPQLNLSDEWAEWLRK